MICAKRPEIWTISLQLRIGQFDAQFGFGQGSYQRNRVCGDPKKIWKLIGGFFDSSVVLRDYTKNICILSNKEGCTQIFSLYKFVTP